MTPGLERAVNTSEVQRILTDMQGHLAMYLEEQTRSLAERYRMFIFNKTRDLAKAGVDFQTSEETGRTYVLVTELDPKSEEDAFVILVGSGLCAIKKSSSPKRRLCLKLGT